MYPPLENFTICITIVWTFKKVHIKSNRRKAKYVLARTYAISTVERSQHYKKKSTKYLCFGVN